MKCSDVNVKCEYKEDRIDTCHHQTCIREFRDKAARNALIGLLTTYPLVNDFDTMSEGSMMNRINEVGWTAPMDIHYQPDQSVPAVKMSYAFNLALDAYAIADAMVEVKLATEK